MAEFAYDALGRRIKKVDSVAGTTNIYYYNDKWQVLCDYNDSGVLQHWFAYGNYIDETLITGKLYLWTYFRYYVHDHLYSPVALTNHTGTVQERYEYDAYGNCHILEPNFAPDPDGKSDYGNPYLFTGRRVDILDNGSLTIQYNRNRYYDQYSGRWLTHDPLEYWDGMNLYAYVGNTPINRVDPLGLKNCCGGTIGGTGWGIGIPIPIPIELPIRAGCWVACRAAERAITALVRGHIDEAFRNYSGMSGSREDPVWLSDSDMEEVMRLYNIKDKIIDPLVEECKTSSEGWTLKAHSPVDLEYSSFGFGEYWYPYDGSWGAALGGGATFMPYSACTCKKLSWSIHLIEEFDFLPLWKSGISRWPRNIIVTMIFITNHGCDCGWRPFFYRGTISGEELIPCP